MIRALVLILFLCSTCFAAEDAQRIYIPLATSLNTETPSHLLQANETSFAKNIKFDNGDIVKRLGVSAIKTFDGEIISYHQATDDYALIAAHNGGDPGGVVLWEWNRQPSPNDIFLNLNTTHLTATSGDFFANYGGGHSAETAALYHPSAIWRFVNHIDPVVGSVTIGTNGEDAPIVYIHADQTYDDIYTDFQERKVDYLYSVTPTWDAEAPSTAVMVKGKYPASFYNSLYLANITSDGSVATSITQTTSVNDPTAIIWSEINDATDFSVAEYYQQRPEGGTEITGLVEFGDNLVLTKPDQIWTIAAYDNFNRLTTQIGATSQEGIISYDSVYVNDKGRILNIINQDHLSFDIHTSFAAEEAGTWQLKAGLNKYVREFAYTAGKKMYTYRQQNKGWQMYQFAAAVDILDYKEPGEPFANWIGGMHLHTNLSIREEDTISDYVLKYGSDGRTLAVMNHFTFDNMTLSSSGEPIDVLYTTPQESCGGVKYKSRFTKIIVQGLADMGPITIAGFFSDSPRKTFTWETLGTITTNSEGFGELYIDKRSIWATLRLTESSINDFRVSEVGLDCIPGGTDR